VVALCFLVATTRVWRIPRTLHIAAWLLVLLGISLARAWGVAFVPSPFAHAPGWLTPPDRQVVATMIDTFVVGLVVGITAAMELCVFLAGSWIGGIVQPKRPEVARTPLARVSLLRRMAVVVLHVPLAAGLFGVASALAAGGLRLWLHDDPLGTAHTSTPAMLAGGTLWLIALVHVDRLFAIGSGARLTRIVLAVTGVVATAILLSTRPSLAGGVLMVAWCIAQLAALWYARGARTDER
jgi:hypothetical protein